MQNAMTKKTNFEAKCNDLDFWPWPIFKVKGQGWFSSWFGVSKTYNFKVVKKICKKQ